MKRNESCRPAQKERKRARERESESASIHLSELVRESE